MDEFFREYEERPALRSVVVGEVELKEGSRVLLWPRAGGDVMDLVLKGKVAFVEGIEQDYEGRIYVAVTLEDDPGRDLGEARFLGHRFFFSPKRWSRSMWSLPVGRRILVAGIGNVFLGDDGFGVEVVRRLAGRGLPEGVEVKDFGIRGMDLAYALQDDYELVVFVDATPRGVSRAPSTSSSRR